MQASHTRSAVDAAKSTASALGLAVDDAVVLNDSNRLAVRLLPCDVLARVAHVSHPKAAGAEFEVEVARRLAETDSPVAGLEPRVEPRVYPRAGFAVTFWTYHEPVRPQDVAPAEYARALERLHAGMRQVDLAAPHFTDPFVEAQRLVGNRAQTPELGDADRELLTNTLRELSAVISQRAATEQLLHGEPHPGNVLRTKSGLLFTDLEHCCRGPVEFDIAHYARVGSDSWHIDAGNPDEVSLHYPGTDRGLVRACWILFLARVAACRWDRNDKFPESRQRGHEWLGYVRTAVSRYGLEGSL